MATYTERIVWSEEIEDTVQQKNRVENNIQANRDDLTSEAATRLAADVAIGTKIPQSYKTTDSVEFLKVKTILEPSGKITGFTSLAIAGASTVTIPAGLYCFYLPAGVIVECNVGGYKQFAGSFSVNATSFVISDGVRVRINNYHRFTEYALYIKL